MKKNFKIYILFSFAIHCIFILLVKFKQISEVIPKKNSTPILISLIESQNQEKTEEKNIKKQQIVSTHQTNDLKPLESDHFLSEKNNQVDEQTQAKIIDSFKQASSPSKQGDSQNVEPSKSKKKTASSESNSQKEDPLDMPSDSLIPKNLNFLSHLENKISQKNKMSSTKIAKEKVSQKENETLDETHEPESLLESWLTPEMQSGQQSQELHVASNNDYLENIKLGNLTQLNTQEFEFYSFYNRIKQKLEQHWGEDLKKTAQRMMAKGVAPEKGATKITSLIVTIDEKGSIVQLRVKDSSGIQDLDHAAIEAFNKAGPFPNPPKKLVQRGQATIEWGFVVKT
jgi:TonB family protein